MPELFGDCDILEAIEQMDLMHRHDDFCATLSDVETSSECCYTMDDIDDDFSANTILLEHDEDDITFMISSLSNETLLTKNNNNTNLFNTPSEAIWDKFDLLEAIGNDVTTTDIITLCNNNEDELNNIKLSSSMESLSSTPCEIRHHDCMWAGKCSSDEHASSSSDDTLTPPLSPLEMPTSTNSTTTNNTVNITTNNNKRKLTNVKVITNSRSILNPLRFQQQKYTINKSSCQQQQQLKSCYIKRSTNLEAKLAINKIVRERMQTTASSMSKLLIDSEGEDQRPDTPVSDFDEQSLFHPHHELQSEDSDEYYSDASDSQSRKIKKEGFENDHSYYIVDNATGLTKLTADILGVQTPSDSEEEIDVVSLGGGEKTICMRLGNITSTTRTETAAVSKPVTIKSTPRTVVRSNLPTNPSPSDKHNLQHCLTEAIAAKRPPSSRATPTVPPLRIRTDCKKRVSAAATATTDTESSSGTDVSTSSSRKRGKLLHKRAASTPSAADTTTPSSSANTSPRKRGSRSGSDSEDSCKRSMHNTMERQRRVDLRIAFENLRILLPKLAEQEKAPKVHILKEAGLYCRQLQITENTMNRKQVELRKKQSMLRDRVSSLRRSLAFHR